MLGETATLEAASDIDGKLMKLWLSAHRLSRVKLFSDRPDEPEIDCTRSSPWGSDDPQCDQPGFLRSFVLIVNPPSNFAARLDPMRLRHRSFLVGNELIALMGPTIGGLAYSVINLPTKSACRSLILRS